MISNKEYKVCEYKKSSTYVKSPFRYPGGKFYALKYILPILDSVDHDEYREPFVGGGSVFFGKDKVKSVWINDLDSELYNVYKVIQDEEKNNKLIELVTKEVATRERYEQIKKMTTPTTKIGKAFRTYYLNRTSFSGILNNPAWGYAEGKSSPPENWGNFLIKSNKKLQGVKITNMDFSEVIGAPSKNKKVLMYLDPPYYMADQKRAYTQSFVLEDHLRLAQLLRETDYHFCLSYDDCPEIRELYSWANIYEKSWLYNTANVKNQSRKKGNELIITNYQLVKNNQLSLDV